MKKIIYSAFSALIAILALASCSSDEYDLGAGRIIGDGDLSWNVVEDGNSFTFTNTSKEINGVTYYITTDGRKSQEFPIGTSETLTVKKNGFYVVSIYAVSRGDQKSLSWTKNVDWFDESVGDPQWLGFTEGNLLAEAKCKVDFWIADNGWGAIVDHQGTFDGYDGSGSLQDGFDLKLPEGMGSSQWQGQMHINETGVALSAGKNYDFSIAIISSADSEGDGVTVKPQKEGEDGTFFSEARHPIKAGVNVITLTDVPGFDGDFKLALDFAGLAGGTEVQIKNIYVAEHKPENVEPEDGKTWAFDFQSASNLLKEADFTTDFWIANDGWGAIVDHQPTFEGFEGDAGQFLFTAPDGMGSSQWQGQTHISFEKVQLSADKKYDFSLVLISDQDAGGVTVKPQKDGEDGTFFSEGRHELKAFQPTAITIPAAAGFDGTFKLCLDFGGTPAGATVKVLGVYLGESK